MVQRFEPATLPSLPPLLKGEAHELRPPREPPPRSAWRPLPRNAVTTLHFVIGLATLLATVVGVIVFLPDYAPNSEPRLAEIEVPAAAVPGGKTPLAAPNERQGASAAPPSDERPSDGFEAERRRAEDALGDWLEVHARLEGRQVARWGGSSYAKAKTRAAVGDEALRQADYATASAVYAEAVGMLQGLEKTIPEVFDATLKAGDEAIGRGDAKAALNAFSLAAGLEPGHPGAERGLERAEGLSAAQAFLASGEAHERNGRLAQAFVDFRAAVQLNSELPSARAALVRIKGRIAAERFQGLMSEGFSALRRGHFQEALAAFRRAKEFRPDASEVEDGMAQATLGLRLARIEDLRQQALEMEAQERWSDALAAYEAAFALDPTLAFAQQGRARTQQLGETAAKLQYYLDQPDLLSSDRVYRRARAFLVKAEGLDPKAPKFREQLRRFKALLTVAGTPLPLELRSDAATEITIHKVGTLGRFTSQTVELRPGTYTVVGARPGYRDVRRTFTLKAGEPPSPVYVACRERV